MSGVTVRLERIRTWMKEQMGINSKNLENRMDIANHENEGWPWQTLSFPLQYDFRERDPMDEDNIRTEETKEPPIDLRAFHGCSNKTFPFHYESQDRREQSHARRYNH